MANNNMNHCVDFEVVDNCSEIDTNVLNQFNNFESFEVEFENIESFFEDEEESIFLECLPSIVPVTTVDDKDILLVKDHSENEEKMKCPNCEKLYKKATYFKKHVDSCGVKECFNKKNKKTMSSKQKKNTEVATILSTDHEFLHESQNYIISALVMSKDDYANNLKVRGIETPGNKVAALASELLQMLSEDMEKKVCSSKDIVNGIVDILQNVNLKISSGREKLWTDLLLNVKSCYKSSSLYLLASKNTSRFQEDVFLSLYTSVSINVLNSVLRYLNQDKSIEQTGANVEMTNPEKQVLYYVSGYVIFSLLKKYRRLANTKTDSNNIKAVIEFLKSLKITCEDLTGNTVAEYVQTWTKLISRGYLITVNDETYQFIFVIEMKVRKVLNVEFLKKYHGQDIRDALQNVLTSDTDVDLAWSRLSRNFSNDKLSLLLKEQIIIKWIDIRANSFVNCYIQFVKRKFAQRKDKKSTLSSSSDPSLRKMLAGGSKN